MNFSNRVVVIRTWNDQDPFCFPIVGLCNRKVALILPDDLKVLVLHESYAYRLLNTQ